MELKLNICIKLRYRNLDKIHFTCVTVKENSYANGKFHGSCYFFDKKQKTESLSLCQKWIAIFCLKIKAVSQTQSLCLLRRHALAGRIILRHSWRIIIFESDDIKNSLDRIYNLVDRKTRRGTFQLSRSTWNKQGRITIS